MALAYSLLFSGTEASTTNGAHTYDANLGSVSANTLIVCGVFGTKTSNSVGSHVFNISKQSGTATISAVTALDTTSDEAVYKACVNIFTFTVATSGTLTLRSNTDASQANGLGAIIIGFTGYDPVTPTIGLVKNNSAPNDGYVGLTLSATPSLSDYVIGFLDADSVATSSKGVDAGSDFTELVEIGTASDNIMAQAQVRTASTSTTVSWADVFTDGLYGNYIASAAASGLIIKASPGGRTISSVASISGISSITL